MVLLVIPPEQRSGVHRPVQEERHEVEVQEHADECQHRRAKLQRARRPEADIKTRGDDRISPDAASVRDGVYQRIQPIALYPADPSPPHGCQLMWHLPERRLLRHGWPSLVLVGVAKGLQGLGAEKTVHHALYPA